MIKIILSWIVLLASTVEAAADSPAPNLNLNPQDKLAGTGIFCGVFANAAVVQDISTGDMSLVNLDNVGSRIQIAIPLSPHSGLRIRKVIDLNADGCSELVVENRAGASFDIWHLEGSHVVRTSTLPVSDFYASGLLEGDFSRTQKGELFVANKTTGEIDSYVSDGLAWKAQTVVPAGMHNGLKALAVSDFHKTGEPEFVFFNPNSAPSEHFVVVGYNIHIGFVRDEGVERSVNKALETFADKLNADGEWNISIVQNPAGKYEPGYLLSRILKSQ